MTFNTLGLKDSLLKAVLDSGYTTPTPIQIQAIPAILSGKDVMAAAQTGTGKTAGFTLPMLQLLGGKTPVKSNHCRALILTPTRELAAQIQESIETYGSHENLRSVVVFGGVNISPQQQKLRKGCDLLVATPGRLLDLYQQNAIRFAIVFIRKVFQPFDVCLIEGHAATKSAAGDTDAAPGWFSRLVKGSLTEPVVQLRAACLQNTQYTALDGKFNFCIRAQETSEARANMVEFAFQHGCQAMQALHRLK